MKKKSSLVSLHSSASTASSSVSSELIPYYFPKAGTVSLDRRYESPQFVAKGAYGRVFRAIDAETGHPVALKYLQILSEDSASDWENSVRILREVFFLKTLKNPLLCPLLDAFPIPSAGRFTHLCLVLPFLARNNENLEISEKAEIAVKLLMGLKTVHSRGLLFRDVKRDNLLISDYHPLLPWGRQPGRIHTLLGDFGLARQKTRKMTSEVQTAAYRDAQLLLGTTEYAEETDAFAAGCVIFEIFAMIDTLFRSGQGQLAAQMALVPPPINTPALEALATNTFLLEIKHKANEEHRGFADSRWDTLKQNLASRPELFPLLKDLLQGLLTVEPSERLSVDQAIQHEFFRRAGVPSEVMAMCETNDDNIILENFQEEVEAAGVTCDLRANAVKQLLWKTLKGTREIFDLPLETVFPEEDVMMREKKDEYVLELEEPVAKRTRLARKMSGNPL